MNARHTVFPRKILERAHLPRNGRWEHHGREPSRPVGMMEPGREDAQTDFRRRKIRTQSHGEFIQ